MKARATAILVAALLVLAGGLYAGVAPANAAASPATLISTFTSVSVYWAPTGGGPQVSASVSYRPLGSAPWTRGADLWFDDRALSGRPPEYRGSIVGLSAGTSYEVKLTLDGSASVTQPVQTWAETFPIGKVIELPANSTTPIDVQEVGS